MRGGTGATTDEGGRRACNRGSCRGHRAGGLRKHEQARASGSPAGGGWVTTAPIPIDAFGGSSTEDFQYG